MDDLWARIEAQNADIDQQQVENDLRERQRDASDLLTLNGSRSSWVWADASPRGTGPNICVALSPMGGSELFATRPIEAGEVVLRELPSFVVKPSDAPDILTQAVQEADSDGGGAGSFLVGIVASVLALWLRSSEAERSHLLHRFFCTPDARGLLAFLVALIEGVQARYEPLASAATDELAQVLCVFLLSSHNLSSGTVDWSNGAGLYAVAHRANHSCDPAVAYRQEAGRLVYRALRPIARGEAVTFSYLFSHELMLPTFLRRRLLEGRKYFWCACVRCTSAVAEAGRTLPCEACALQGGTGLKPHTGEGGRAATAVSGGGVGDGGDLARATSGSTGVSGGQWGACTVCSSEAPPSDAMFAEEERLCQQALTELPLSAEEQIRQLEQQPGWHGHWVWSAALWRCGLQLLRGGVWEGDEARARLGWPLLQAHVRWADEHHGPRSRHFLASQMAEVFACLAAFVAGTQEQAPHSSYEAAALAVRLCGPFLRVLELEYGEQDDDCQKMRRFFLHHCGKCGKRAPRSLCSRCKVVSYCSANCQRAAWPEHKRMCGAASRAPTPTNG